MKLLVGLGNPGEKFKKTRHNVGFMALDMISSKIQSSGWRIQSNFNAEISEASINGEKILLAKPQTFMNESGNAVRAIANYYKINTVDIIIIHDDLDIAIGKYKIARDRTSAGHKGVQSIIDHLGTKDFTRIRIGIEIPECKIPTEKFVLENFTKEEEKMINEIIEKTWTEIEILIKK
jgi:PTH1 family peptidyl-tRNA hydrolase